MRISDMMHGTVRASCTAARYTLQAIGLPLAILNSALKTARYANDRTLHYSQRAFDPEQRAKVVTRLEAPDWGFVERD